MTDCEWCYMKITGDLIHGSLTISAGACGGGSSVRHEDMPHLLT